MSYDTIEEKAATSFFNKKNAPSHFTKRTKTKFGSIPLLELKEKGIWNPRLEKIIVHLPKGAWIAGGFLRAMIAGEDELGGDVDFFFNNEQSFEKMLDIIKNPTSNSKKIFNYYSLPELDTIKKFRIVNAESIAQFRPDLQLVRLFWFDSPEHVIDSFDFTVCQFITDGKTLWFGPKSFEDIKNKTIRWHRETGGDGIAALNRIIKYQHKGYKMAVDAFNFAEQNALKMLIDSDAMNKHFTQDKIESEIHKHGISVYQRAWDYLSTSPVTRSAANKALKKKNGQSRLGVDRTKYQYDGS